jgi:hypothetical protein
MRFPPVCIFWGWDSLQFTYFEDAIPSSLLIFRLWHSLPCGLILGFIIPSLIAGEWINGSQTYIDLNYVIYFLSKNVSKPIGVNRHYLPVDITGFPTLLTAQRYPNFGHLGSAPDSRRADSQQDEPKYQQREFWTAAPIVHIVQHMFVGPTSGNCASLNGLDVEDEVAHPTYLLESS